ncbi:MAG UNVERIFIED_CONTAM: ABC transporter substrate-binding protein [Microcystis novacekii LVE1205-3]|jgi:branched-chain amino acid transport system substrate-binding protein
MTIIRPQISKEVASELVKNPDIIAVIGHNASDASLAAAPIYEKGGLVMISPTSLANNLSGAGNYIFRLVASSGKITEKLANYIVNTAKVRKIAFCYDSQAPDNISFKDELMANVAKKGGQIVPIVCDLSVPNFKANQALNQAISGVLTAYLSSLMLIVSIPFLRSFAPIVSVCLCLVVPPSTIFAPSKMAAKTPKV